MNNDDNRTQILARQVVNEGHTMTTLCRLHEIIEQKNTYITTLEVELADMTAQRDAWQTMAIELEQLPERLKAAEAMPEVELTDTEADMLSSGRWRITPAALVALAAYKVRNESEGE